MPAIFCFFLLPPPLPKSFFLFLLPFSLPVVLQGKRREWGGRMGLFSFSFVDFSHPLSLFFNLWAAIKS